MHAAIVETDPDTAEVTILRYCVVHDCGRLINPRIVEGQIHGGVAQGVGGALYERMAYDDTGQLVNASFMDFLMPYVSEVPTRIEIGHLETPSPLNPLGIKGGRGGCHPRRRRPGRRHRRRRRHPHHEHAPVLRPFALRRTHAEESRS
jgi:carbon-monoxide dehydrogenase large subunit